MDIPSRFKPSGRRLGNQTNWQLRRGDLLCAVLAGLLALVMQSRLSAGLPPAVASPNGLPWVQTFSDDFTSPTGTLSGWKIELGTGSQYGLVGWGNNEAESYTADPSNLNISGGAEHRSAGAEQRNERHQRDELRRRICFHKPTACFSSRPDCRRAPIYGRRFG